MRRPVAVTVSAVIAILGSILALLFAAGAFVSLFFATSRPQPDTTVSAAGGALMFGAFGFVGVWTGIGLFRLRPVARISVLVFSAFLAAMSVFVLMLFSVMPIPPDISAETAKAFRRSMMIGAAIPLAISIWWLIQFNMQSIKAAFAPSLTESQSPRPLVITVIAWYGISLLHLLVIEIVPPLRTRLIALQESLIPDQTTIPFGREAFMAGMLGISAVVVVAVVWFLVRERAVFTPAHNAA